MFKRKTLSVVFLAAVVAIILGACTPQTEAVPVEVTRVVTETVTLEGEPVEVTRIVTETIIEAATAVPEPPVSKDLIVCMGQEPDTLYTYGSSLLASSTIQHALFEIDYTNLSYGYQAHGLESLPSLSNGGAVLNEVAVQEGDRVVNVSGDVVELTTGEVVQLSDGREVTFEGTPLTMNQLVVDFTMKPRVWADGTPVTAADSLWSFMVDGSPDTQTGKFTIERTAAYEATGERSTRWTGVPGFMDSLYFTNFWAPLPEHLWGHLTPAELITAEESTRLPVGDGPFKLVEWIAGDSIRVERNEYYYRADEGLPYLDSVTYKFIPDTNQLLAQLLSGQCDIGTQDGINESQSPFLIEAEENGLLIPYFQTGTAFEHIDFGIDPYGDYANSRPDWFEDVRVRQAMLMCTDRQSMVDSILYGRTEVIHGYVPTIHPLYPDEGMTEWPYDVGAANALLDEVGFIDSDGDGLREYYAAGTAGGDASWDGEPFSVPAMTTVANDMREQIMQIFQANMADCGIKIVLNYLPAGEYFADGPDGPLFGRHFDLGLFAWLTGVDPSCDLFRTSNITGPIEEGFGGWGNVNNTGWSNEAFDAACTQALSNLPGTPEYEEGHKEAQRIFSQELPIMPIFLRLKVAAARTGVVNFGVDPTENSELWNIFEIDLEG
ncbi:MAG: peptide ABC transporter substrate-binding protein [Ardenticatenaceae bacterium]|nr:peptide ABC transporter substrate-binding protein [Ardenticatenaceae bacterium]